MRRAQLRLRHVITMAAVALLVALATLSGQGQRHAPNWRWPNRSRPRVSPSACRMAGAGTEPRQRPATPVVSELSRWAR